MRKNVLQTDGTRAEKCCCYKLIISERILAELFICKVNSICVGICGSVRLPSHIADSIRIGTLACCLRLHLHLHLHAGRHSMNLYLYLYLYCFHFPFVSCFRYLYLYCLFLWNIEQKGIFEWIASRYLCADEKCTKIPKDTTKQYNKQIPANCGSKQPQLVREKLTEIIQKFAYACKHKASISTEQLPHASIRYFNI